MKKIAVVYSSKSGHTKQYVDWLKEEIADIDAIPLATFSPSQTMAYKLVIFACGVYGDKLSIMDYVKKNINAMAPQKTMIMAVSWYTNDSEEAKQKLIEENYPEQFKNTVPIFVLNSGINKKQLSAMDKMKLTAAQVMIDKKDGRSSDDINALAIIKGYSDQTSRDNLASIKQAIDLFFNPPKAVKPAVPAAESVKPAPAAAPTPAVSPAPADKPAPIPKPIDVSEMKSDADALSSLENAFKALKSPKASEPKPETEPELKSEVKPAPAPAPQPKPKPTPKVDPVKASVASSVKDAIAALSSGEMTTSYTPAPTFEIDDSDSDTYSEAVADSIMLVNQTVSAFITAETASPKEIQHESKPVETAVPKAVQPESKPVEAAVLKAVQPESKPVEAVAPKAVQPEPKPVEAVVPKAVQPEPKPVEAVAPKAVQPELKPVEAAVPKAVQSESKPVEAVAPKAVQPEPKPVEAAVPKAVQPESKSVENVSVEAPQPQRKNSYMELFARRRRNTEQAASSDSASNVAPSTSTSAAEELRAALSEHSAQTVQTSRSVPQTNGVSAVRPAPIPSVPPKPAAQTASQPTVKPIAPAATGRSNDAVTNFDFIMDDGPVPTVELPKPEPAPAISTSSIDLDVYDFISEDSKPTVSSRAMNAVQDLAKAKAEAEKEKLKAAAPKTESNNDIIEKMKRDIETLAEESEHEIGAAAETVPVEDEEVLEGFTFSNDIEYDLEAEFAEPIDMTPKRSVQEKESKTNLDIRKLQEEINASIEQNRATKEKMEQRYGKKAKEEYHNPFAVQFEEDEPKGKKKKKTVEVKRLADPIDPDIFFSKAGKDYDSTPGAMPEIKFRSK